MPSNETQRLAQIIKESIDNVDITNRFKSSKPCIMRGHELLISNNSIFDQEIKDEIDKQIMDIGMAAYHVETTSRGIHIKSINTNEMYGVMPAVIGGLKHDILIVDDIYNPMNNYIELQHDKPFIIYANPCRAKRYVNAKQSALIDKIDIPTLEEVKENHPHGWYRKFEKKRF